MRGPRAGGAGSGSCEVWLRRCATLPCPLGHSTIAVPGLSFRVRNGTGRLPWAMAAAKFCYSPFGWRIWEPDRGRACWRMLVFVWYRRDDAAGVFRLVSWWCWLSSTVSAGRLHPSRGFHVRSINHMFSMGSHTPPRGVSGILILERASRLDAFSGYPSRTWPTSRAPGGTTGIPEVRPPRSSRTMGRPPQDSNERRG